ncbi:F-box protein PP2-A11 [Silene latifolia]|uniref:F-box protein PP2-A11 n=1 Tax=Silene latifolia TaxID=37657 RepID=UPI003D771CB8
MGAGLSSLLDTRDDNGPGLGELPENCVAVILGRLSPPEICKFAKVNKTFYGASLGDVVWETKLPSNYEVIVSKLCSECSKGVSKKDVYHMLCGPIRFDAGTKEMWMERKSGKMFMSISWKGLRITGINDRRYWSHIPTDESRFHSVAYLHQIWWLEAEGEVEFNFPAGDYSLVFRLRLGKSSKRLGMRVGNYVDKVHGWNIKPVRFQLSASNGQHSSCECFLKEVGTWKNYHVGNFTVGTGHIPIKIKFSMAQIHCTHTKGGLCLDSVIICPCESVEGS